MIRLFGAPSSVLAGALAFDVDELRIRMPDYTDFATWADERARSRDFLQRWEPTWPADDLTEKAFRRRVARYREEVEADLAYPYFITLREGGAILGGLTLANVRRRAAMSASLGYWMGAQHAGKGIMSRAVPALCRHAFSLLALERVEAACLPENAASIRVLEKAGFRREGFARGYLAIAGVRRDHITFALLRSDLGRD